LLGHQLISPDIAEVQEQLCLMPLSQPPHLVGWSLRTVREVWVNLGSDWGYAFEQGDIPAGNRAVASVGAAFPQKVEEPGSGPTCLACYSIQLKVAQPRAGTSA
jgi:hypothetical protein